MQIKKRNKIMIIYLKRNIFFEMLIYNGVIKFVTDKIPLFLNCCLRLNKNNNW